MHLKKNARFTFFFVFFSPEFPVLYQSDEEQERLMQLYQDLHSHLHHPTRPLRFFYRCGETENLLAWVNTVLSQRALMSFQGPPECF